MKKHVILIAALTASIVVMTGCTDETISRTDTGRKVLCIDHHEYIKYNSYSVITRYDEQANPIYCENKGTQK